MPDRISGAQRLKLQAQAETEVMRYAADHGLWHKHVHNVELDPMQVLKCIEMDRHPRSIDFSCRRTGKTAVKELYLLKHNATHADQEEGIVAPREAQSLVNLGYHLDAIRRSEILTAHLHHLRGRTQMADTYYQFANRSVARAYGIMAQVDGGDLTTASLEEVDDMPKDRLYARFLLMLGSTRRLGAHQASRNDPQIRITGVFKGADTLSAMVASGEYRVLPPVDAYLGIELGIINEDFIDLMRSQLSPDEYLRQLLCRNVSSRNLIWECKIRDALTLGLKSGVEWVEPLPGVRHKKRGLLAFGYDASGHGEDVHASRHAFVVLEQMGNFTAFIFAKTWAPGADDQTVKRDLRGFWEYFRPDFAIGDAYGVGMLSQLNDELYAEGLSDIDRRTIGDGNSTASTWMHWAFAPLRFEGMTKHSMATAIRALFHDGLAVIPYLDDLDPADPDTSDHRLLIRQLGNIRPVPTKAAYASYKMADPKIGDDLFDAAMAAIWALETRGVAGSPTQILMRHQSRQSLLAAPGVR
ncbi:MAG: hypothetical protein EA420_03185 [Candidatus Competibacteraceae bacterium]|nr:MAG: hypothetical protein EA420_03185 [Candidatus Competibacteraceae bacterium]